VLIGAALKEHTLNRLGYGPSRWHADRYDELGFDAYVAEQLAGSLAAISDTGTTIAAKVARSVASQRQLETVLIDFWFNHFNVDTLDTDPDKRDNTIAGRTTSQLQNSAIAPNILGNFGDMLLATAKAPAMLDYLDNRINYEEEIVNGNEYGLNENYAREIMELHTLGVGGGYSEQDVTAVARILTGWSVQSDAFKFKSARHDGGEKTVMGVIYPAGRGEEEGVEFLDFLASHPSTASFLSYKLAARFVNDVPPGAAVVAASSTFAQSGGDLGQVMNALVMSDVFRADSAFRAKAKPPHRYIASALLAMGAETTGHYSAVSGAAAEAVELCGEVPYVVAPPTGYPETSNYWISGTSMLARFAIAETIAWDSGLRNRLKARAGVDGADALDTVDAIAAEMIPGGIAETTRAAALDYMTTHAASNDERVSAAAHMLLSSPEFVRF